MNDAATLAGKSVLALKLDGETYEISPLTLADFGDLQAWLDKQMPNPLDVIRPFLQNYNAAQQQAMIKSAVELASTRRALIGTPEAGVLLSSIDGIREMLFLGIRKARPEITRPDVAVLAAKLSVADITALFQATGISAVAEADEDDPKGRSTGGTSITS